VTHVAEDSARRLEGGHRLAVDRAERALRERGEPERLPRWRHRLDEGTRERRRSIGISVDVSGYHVEHQRGVAHRAGDRPVGEEATPDLAGDGREGDASARRLEPDHAATGSRDAHRAAAVAALGERAEPGRDLRGRAAARASGRVLQVPRVSRRWKEAAFRGRPAPVFRGGRLADQDAACAPQPDDDLGVGWRDEARVVPRAERGADSLRPREVLDRNGTPKSGNAPGTAESSRPA
jgi:hypothetical protein